MAGRELQPNVIWPRTACWVEIVTGTLLFFTPSSVARAVFGEGMTASGEAVGRFAGIVLVFLALACMPSEGRYRKLVPLMALSWIVAVYLAVYGVFGARAGVLLWPAAIAHLSLGVGLTRARMVTY